MKKDAVITIFLSLMACNSPIITQEDLIPLTIMETRFNVQNGVLNDLRLFNLRPFKWNLNPLNSYYHDGTWSWLLTRLGINPVSGPFPTYELLMMQAASLTDFSGYDAARWVYPLVGYRPEQYACYVLRRNAGQMLNGPAVSHSVGKTHNRIVAGQAHHAILNFVSDTKVQIEYPRYNFTNGGAPYMMSSSDYSKSHLNVPFVSALITAYPSLGVNNKTNLQYYQYAQSFAGIYFDPSYSNPADALTIVSLPLDVIKNERYKHTVPYDSSDYWAKGMIKYAQPKLVDGVYGFESLNFDFDFKLTKVSRVNSVNAEDYLSKQWPIVAVSYDSLTPYWLGEGMEVGTWFGKTIPWSVNPTFIPNGDYLELLVISHNLNDSPSLISNGYYFNNYYRAYMRNDIIRVPTFWPFSWAPVYGTLIDGFIKNPLWSNALNYGVTILSYGENLTINDVSASLELLPY